MFERGQRRVAAGGEVCRDTTELRGATHRCLDKVGQRLTGQQDRIEVCAQLGLDSNLGNDGCPQGPSVVRAHCMLNRRDEPSG
jgi:hypothetical protein